MCKVLIIESNPTTMFLYRKILQNEGHYVLMSSSRTMTMNIMKKYRPDMIITASTEDKIIVQKTDGCEEYIIEKPVIFEALTRLIRQIQESIINPKNCSYA